MKRLLYSQAYSVKKLRLGFCDRAISTKSSILDIWLGSEYTSDTFLLYSLMFIVYEYVSVW